MGSALELLPGVLILVDSAKDGDNFLLGGQGDGAGDGSAVALGSLDDLLSALIDELMIVSLQPDADHFLVCHNWCFLLDTYSVMLSLGTVENLYPLGRVYHSAPQKKADICRPNIRNAAIYSVNRPQIVVLSRPMTGHTLRKLPCRHAISRFIAYCAC